MTPGVPARLAQIKKNGSSEQVSKKRGFLRERPAELCPDGTVAGLSRMEIMRPASER